MSLFSWDLAEDDYNHAQLSANWQNIDFHDHSPGRGVQISGPGIAPGSISSAHLASDLTTELSGFTASLTNNATWSSGTEAAKPAASSVPRRFYYATDSNALYYSDGTTWRTVYGSRAGTNIAAVETRTNTAYGLMTTPDQVTNIVLPANGLIVVWYQAMWQESVNGAARAAIFLNGNQLQKVQSTATTPVTQAAQTGHAGAANVNRPLATGIAGLSSDFGTVSYTGDVTTGQLVGIGNAGSNVQDVGGGDYSPGSDSTFGPCHIFAAAGTYTVNVQFKASSGNVVVSNRRLMVQALSFS